MIGTDHCLLKYNNKGVQYEHKISPITLKQLFIPFLFLICGWILGFLQFLREKMHAHFRCQMITEQENAHPITTSVPPVIEAPLIITDIEIEPEVAHEIPKLSGIDLSVRNDPETPPVATPTESPPSDPNTTSHPGPTTKSIPLVNPSNSLVTALPSNESPLAVIDISNDPETESHNEEMELKTVVTIADIHQQPKEKATGTKPKSQPKSVAPVKKKKSLSIRR